MFRLLTGIHVLCCMGMFAYVSVTWTKGTYAKKYCNEMSGCSLLNGNLSTCGLTYVNVPFAIECTGSSRCCAECKRNTQIEGNVVYHSLHPNVTLQVTVDTYKLCLIDMHTLPCVLSIVCICVCTAIYGILRWACNKCTSSKTNYKNSERIIMKGCVYTCVLLLVILPGSSLTYMCTYMAVYISELLDCHVALAQLVSFAWILFLLMVCTVKHVMCKAAIAIKTYAQNMLRFSIAQSAQHIRNIGYQNMGSNGNGNGSTDRAGPSFNSKAPSLSYENICIPLEGDTCVKSPSLIKDDNTVATLTLQQERNMEKLASMIKKQRKSNTLHKAVIYILVLTLTWWILLVIYFNTDII